MELESFTVSMNLYNESGDYVDFTIGFGPQENFKGPYLEIDGKVFMLSSSHLKHIKNIISRMDTNV